MGLTFGCSSQDMANGGMAGDEDEPTFAAAGPMETPGMACTSGQTGSCSCGAAMGSTLCRDNLTFSACLCDDTTGVAGPGEMPGEEIVTPGEDPTMEDEEMPSNVVDVDCFEEIGLNPPANGIQVCSVGTQIQAGQDVEYCEVVQVPGTADDLYHVNRFETQMTANSHHLIVSYMTPGGNADTSTTVGDRVNCITGDVFGDDVSGVIGAQQPYHERQYPANVARIYQGGTKLVFDYHYFNVTDDEIHARAAVNFHTIDEADVEHVAHGFGMYNFGINTPAGATATFTKSCDFTDDIMVHSLTRHTHKWGTDFKVSYDGGPNDGDVVWLSEDWELDIGFEMPGGPTEFKAGTGFTFECTFDNTTNSSLRFGTTASDEMCILFGTWWKKNESDNVGSQGCRSF